MTAAAARPQEKSGLVSVVWDILRPWGFGLRPSPALHAPTLPRHPRRPFSPFWISALASSVLLRLDRRCPTLPAKLKSKNEFRPPLHEIRQPTHCDFSSLANRPSAPKLASNTLQIPSDAYACHDGEYQVPANPPAPREISESVARARPVPPRPASPVHAPRSHAPAYWDLLAPISTKN
jgi:hypothetical protein